MRRQLLAVTLPATVAAIMCGCSHTPDQRAASSGVSTPSQATVSGVPQSKWATSAPSSASVSASSLPGGPPTSMPKAGQTAKAFVVDFLHTDGVSQETWASTVAHHATASFAGRLSSQGLERLPHGAKVTGNAQQLWISSQDPSGAWFVPTSDGGYTVTMDLTSPEGKAADITPGKDTGSAADSAEPQD